MHTNICNMYVCIIFVHTCSWDMYALCSCTTLQITIQILSVWGGNQADCIQVEPKSVSEKPLAQTFFCILRWMLNLQKVVCFSPDSKLPRSLFCSRLWAQLNAHRCTKGWKNMHKNRSPADEPNGVVREGKLIEDGVGERCGVGSGGFFKLDSRARLSSSTTGLHAEMSVHACCSMYVYIWVHSVLWGSSSSWTAEQDSARPPRVCTEKCQCSMYMCTHSMYGCIHSNVSAFSVIYDGPSFKDDVKKSSSLSGAPSLSVRHTLYRWETHLPILPPAFEKAPVVTVETEIK